MMELASLQAFVEVARTGSFSQAAGVLHLTQPAVSKRVATLEQTLNTRLFDRVGRQIYLTEAGRALLPRASSLLAEAVNMRRLAANLSGEVAGILTMGTSHHVGLHRLPPVLRAYSLRYPKVRLDIRFTDSEAACRQVETGDLELAVVTLPTKPPSKLELTEVWPDPLVFAVGPGHPLAQLPSLELKQLLSFPALLPAAGTYTREVLAHAIPDQEIKLGLSTNYLETLKMLASVELGWTLLPATMLDQQLVALQVRGLQLQRQLGVVTHRRRTLSNAAQAMRDACLGARRPEASCSDSLAAEINESGNI